MSPRNPQVHSLTSLRFFLGIWVVFFHEADWFGYMGDFVSRAPNALFCLLRTGYMAVGVFFVLFGFVLAYNYSLDHPWTSEVKRRFAIARFARIYPAYCLGLVLMAPIVAEGLLKAFTVTRAFREAGVAILNWTLLQSWIPYTATTWNGPGWSLSDEAFFYLCFPIFGVLLRRCSRLRTVSTVGLFLWTAALLAAAIAVMKAVPGLGNVPATISSATSPILWKNFVRFNPLVRIPEFCAGILLARIYGLLRHRKSWLVGRGYYLYVPGLILEFCVILQAKHLPYVLVHNGLLLPLHGCVILGFALGGGIMVRALSLPVLVFGGNASYAMYILHSPIRDWLDFTVKELHFQPLNGLGAMAMYVGLVIAISSAAFQWIEQPANHYLRAKLQSWANQNADPKAPQLVMADFLPNANF